MSTNEGAQGDKVRQGRPVPTLRQQNAQQARTMRDRLNDATSRDRRGNPADVRIHPDDDPEKFEYFFLDTVLTTRSGDDATAVEAALDDRFANGEVVRQDDVPIEDVTTFRLPAGTDIDALCDELDLAVRPGVAMPDHVLHVTPTGCCPATEPIPWDAGPVPPVTGSHNAGHGVKVVVIDTGRVPQVENDHAWLDQPKITGHQETLASSGHYAGHGTFVCGVLRTMAPQTEIDVNALHFAAGAVVESDLAVQLRDAVRDDKPAIISMSAGTTTRKGFPPIALTVVCEKLPGAHIVLVAAAGNDGLTHAFYPAYFSHADPRVKRAANPNVVSVGALDQEGNLASYSNYQWPLVYARGSAMVNGYPRNPSYVYQEPPRRGWPNANFKDGFALWDGTSFATPLVAGRIAAQMTTAAGQDAEAAWATLYVAAVANTGPDGSPRVYP
jgi:Subtilase family